MMQMFDDLEELSRGAAEMVAASVDGSGSNPDPPPPKSSPEYRGGLEDIFTVALAGGNTPRVLYELLASDYRERIDWGRVEFFWGDERYVPEDSPKSNYRMAREALLDHLSIPADHIHLMRTDFDDPAEAAASYTDTLRVYFPDGLPRFDLILLGIGDDGHTASLFPGSPALAERERLVAVTQSPIEPTTRLTLTPPVLANAKQLVFLVSGRSKREVMRAIIEQPELARAQYPAAMVAAMGNAVWMVDREAMGD